MIRHTLKTALLACLPLGSVLAHTSGTSTEPVDGATLVAASFALTGHPSEGPGAALPWALGVRCRPFTSGRNPSSSRRLA